MKAPALALLILGGVTLAAPALAADDASPPGPPAAAPAPSMPPATEYMPPVTDEKLPVVPAPDAELPTVPPPETTTAQPELPVLPSPDAPAGKNAASSDCSDCSPPKVYDSQEVIKKIRKIDRSRTINTTEMAPDYAPRPDHSPAYRVRSDVTLVNFVVHRYRVIYAPELVTASEAGGYGGYRPLRSESGYRPVYWPHRPHRVACRSGTYNRYDGCRPLLRVRG